MDVVGRVVRERKVLRKDRVAINCGGQGSGGSSFGEDQGQGLGHAEFEVSVTHQSR